MVDLEKFAELDDMGDVENMADQDNMGLPCQYDGTYEPITDEAYVNCGAEELALKLLGKYLYGSQSDIMIRIVESEAYPHGDGVYDRIFDDVPVSFANKAGVMLRLNEALHYIPTKCQPVNGEHVYITAGGTEESSDLVLIRSCEPRNPEIETVRKMKGLLGYNAHTSTSERQKVLINPRFVAKALANDWESNSVLYEVDGYQLCFNLLDNDPTSIVLEPVKHGRRVLASKFRNWSGPGYIDKLRFALTNTESYNNFEDGKELEFMPCSCPSSSN